MHTTRIRAAAAALATAMFTPLAAVPAAAEVIETSEDHFVTRDTRVIAAEPYEVWAALIAPGTWWNDAHTWSGEAGNMYLSAQAGGCFCELLAELEDAPQGVRRGSARHMEVLQAAPPSVLRMRGGLGPLQSEPVDGVLTITLRPVDGGTRVLWEYVVGGAMRFEVPVIAEAVDGVMSQQLLGLARLLGEAEGEAGDDTTDDDTAGDDDTDEVSDEDTDDSAVEDADTGSDDADSDGADAESARKEVRIEPKRVLSLEEAIDAMAGSEDE